MLEDRNLVPLTEDEMIPYRGSGIAMVFQDPMTSLDPTMTIGKQITEGIILHEGVTKQEAKERAIHLLTEVGIENPEKRFKQYPHQLSGGMRQRVVIAIALAADPDILICDEPTTALDVTIQAQILELINKLKAERNLSVIFITHDLGVVASLSNRISVMYGGLIMEEGLTDEIFYAPKHPYTRSLFNSIPQMNSENEKLKVIQGMVPSLINLPRTGCRVASRIPWVESHLHEEDPQLHEISSGHFVRCTCWKHFQFEGEEGGK